MYLLYNLYALQLDLPFKNCHFILFRIIKFRVALILSSNHEKELFSEQSVIISTLPMGKPLSEPAIVRAVAVDHTRISVSWEPGPFPNGPILSYVLKIKDLSPTGYLTLKVAKTRFY